MPGWRPVSLVTSCGELRAPGHVVDEVRRGGAEDGVLLTGHLFGASSAHAHLLCHHLAHLARPWAAQAAAEVGRRRTLLRLARRSGCRALVIGPHPDPLPRAGEPKALRAAAADLRAIRRAGLMTVLHLTLGCADDDAGVFRRAVRLATRGRVTFPRFAAAAADGAMEAEEVAAGLAWARCAVHAHRIIWWRTVGAAGSSLGALVANYQERRAAGGGPRPRETDAMRLSRALARPIRIRERVAFVSTLVGAVHAGGDQLRSAWLRARAARDVTVAALVIRLEGAVDARAARTLVARARRGLRGTRARVVVDVGGLELVSLTVLTRFLEEHSIRLRELRGRLAFRNLRPALAALRRNLPGALPDTALLEEAIEETV